MSHQPTGFTADRILNLETDALNAQPPVFWEQVAEQLRTVPGVETVALASRSLLSGDSWNDSVSVDGGPPSDDLTYFMKISPGWLDAMKIPLMHGRDFRAEEKNPGFAIVNDTFARRYFRNENPTADPSIK